MNIASIQEQVRTAWSAQTTANEVFDPENAAAGQCAITALLLQDLLGGDLVWAEVQLPNGALISHYWNRIDGVDKDLTRDQFPEGTIIPAGSAKPGEFDSTRQRVLSFEQTRVRYGILRHRFFAAQAAAAAAETAIEGRTHKQAIVVRKDLGMRAGKMNAQGAHASMKAVLDEGFEEIVRGQRCLCLPLDDPRMGPWLSGKFAKIGLRTESEADLLDIYRRAKEAGLIASLILDAGLTEFDGPTYTTVAVGPDVAEKVDAITADLKPLDPGPAVEFDKPTYTAVAVGPDVKDKVDSITSNLKLL